MFTPTASITPATHLREAVATVGAWQKEGQGVDEVDAAALDIRQGLDGVVLGKDVQRPPRRGPKDARVRGGPVAAGPNGPVADGRREGHAALDHQLGRGRRRRRGRRGQGPWRRTRGLDRAARGRGVDVGAAALPLGSADGSGAPHNGRGAEVWRAGRRRRRRRERHIRSASFSEKGYCTRGYLVARRRLHALERGSTVACTVWSVCPR